MSTLAQSRPVATSVAGTSFIDRLGEFAASWRAERARRAAVRRTLAELESLSDHELDDLGVTRWDLPRVARDAVYGR